MENMDWLVDPQIQEGIFISARLFTSTHLSLLFLFIKQLWRKQMSHLLVFLFGVGLYFWEAFVYWKLWVWFLVPLGFPALTAAHIYGICLFVSLVVFRNPPSEIAWWLENGQTQKDLDYRDHISSIKLGVGYVLHLIGLLLGALLHFWM